MRALRRWTLVAGVWAIAATAVGLIALLDTSGDAAQRAAGQAAGRVATLERGQARLARRARDLQRRLAEVPSARDTETLEQRVAAAEKDSAGAASDAKAAGDRAGKLERRIATLEQAPAQGPSDAADPPGAADPPPGE